MKLLKSSIYVNDLNNAIDSTDFSEMMGKTVLITGGLGLIGSAIVDLISQFNVYKDADIRIYLAARNYEQFTERYGELKFIQFIQYDATKDFSLPVSPDYIIHCAGAASPELYTSEPVETILSNFRGVDSLLEYVKDNGGSRLLYVSSSEVYGLKSSDEPFVEDCYGLVNLDSVRSSYPVAKRASEMLCRAYWNEYSVDTVIVRPGHIYGPTATQKDKRISSDFPKRAARGENLEMKSSGLQKRSYCYCVDAAVQILTVLLSGQAGEAYNVGHDQTTTIREMAEIVAKAGNVSLFALDPTDDELKAFNPMNNSLLNNEKVKKLGYQDIFSVQEGLAHTVQIIKELHKKAEED